MAFAFTVVWVGPGPNTHTCASNECASTFEAIKPYSIVVAVVNLS